MRAGILCFTDAGEWIAKRVREVLCDLTNIEALAEKKSKYACVTDAVNHTEKSLGHWTKDHWDDELIVFVGACGIAVRAIAPYVKSKAQDPAVLVIDEKGKFCISLLSGHIGGGNLFVEQIAKEIDAMPVITTATDLNDKFAVDVFAKNQNLVITDLKMIKVISSAILKGETVGLICDLPIKGEIPSELTLLTEEEQENKQLEKGIYIGFYDRSPFEVTMQLVPRIMSLGMGCRRGVEKAQTIDFVDHIFEDCGLKKEALYQLSSIDIKKDEACLIGLGKYLNIPFCTYDLESLQNLKGEFKESPFVKKTVGVGNVCERSALIAAGEKGELLFRKMTKDGMTLSVAVKRTPISF